jgi:hypothetical protein
MIIFYIFYNFLYFLYMFIYKMNQLILAIIALVVFICCGGKYVPSVLKQNKEILLGVSAGMVLCTFMGKNYEGLTNLNPECCADEDVSGGTPYPAHCVPTNHAELNKLGNYCDGLARTATAPRAPSVPRAPAPGAPPPRAKAPREKRP